MRSCSCGGRPGRTWVDEDRRRITRIRQLRVFVRACPGLTPGRPREYSIGRRKRNRRECSCRLRPAPGDRRMPVGRARARSAREESVSRNDVRRHSTSTSGPNRACREDGRVAVGVLRRRALRSVAREAADVRDVASGYAAPSLRRHGAARRASASAPRRPGGPSARKPRAATSRPSRRRPGCRTSRRSAPSAQLRAFIGAMSRAPAARLPRLAAHLPCVPSSRSSSARPSTSAPSPSP